MHPELQMAEQLAREAGALMLRIAEQGYRVEEKTPDDPVTLADRAASELIVSGLRASYPRDGILSEELADSPGRLECSRVWIIDPIDGTREFVSGSADYAVSIGLAVDGEPVLGAVFAPARGDMYLGAVGQGVWKNGQPAGLSGRPLQEALVAVSDSEYARELHGYALPNQVPSGSIAYKLARIATGEADATFTINPRAEWDIAAGHALLRAAGGELATRDGVRIRYNRPQPKLRRGIIGGRPDVLASLLRRLSQVGIPEQQLYLRDTDAEWAYVGEDRDALRGHPHLHVRHAAGSLEALVTLEQRDGRWRVTRSQGREFALGRLLKDLQREYGPLTDGHLHT